MQRAQHTLNGRLLLGVLYQGKLHFDFSVNVLSLGGECAALDTLAELGIEGENLTIAERTLTDLAYLQQQLVIDGIPQAALTPAFLLDNLSTDDYLLVQTQIALLRKKRQDAGESLATAESESGIA